MRPTRCVVCLVALAGVATAAAKPGHEGTTAVVARVDGGVTTVRILPSLGADRAIRQRRVPGLFALATVARDGAVAGATPDGDTIVLQGRPTGAERRFVHLEDALRRRARFFTLPSRFSVDALSRDGRRLYLTESGVAADPLAYAVRIYDLTTNRLVNRPVVEKGGEQMAGEPMARIDHPSEPWSYTLYAGGRGPFVHALNTARSFSLCIDLPWAGLTSDQATGLRLRLDARDRLRVVTSTRPVRTLAVIDRQNGTVRALASPV